MAESLSNWLALREPADIRARSTILTRAIAGVLDGREPLNIVDLGTGTGSNVRYLRRHFPAHQRWLLVDKNPALLAEAAARITDCPVETRCLDLGSALDPTIFSGRHLVTASALLDLVSETWIETLASHARRNGAAALFALTYNGRSSCTPEEPEDDEIRELMNRHQRANDHGFGRAAGPDAVESADRCFTAAGYHVRRETSDWVLAPEQSGLQRQLIEGWAEAAREIAPGRTAAIDAWLARRLAHVDGGHSRIIVCHEDLAAWPSSAPP
jgi:hypothetical protein